MSDREQVTLAELRQWLTRLNAKYNRPQYDLIQTGDGEDARCIVGEGHYRLGSWNGSYYVEMLAVGGGVTVVSPRVNTRRELLRWLQGVIVGPSG